MVLDDFLRRVAEAPEAIAVQDGARRLTYLELARHASDLAARLTRRGVGIDDVVAVYADRSAEIVVAELAALLSGAAYLPLDPAHPPARTGELLALATPAAVISTGPLAASGAVPEGTLVVDLSLVPTDSAISWERPQETNLAYVIYTSGSTGRPKGCAVRHGGLANLMRWHERTFSLGPQDRTTLLVSPGFDVSVWDTWPTLASGGTLVVPPAQVRTSPQDLVAWLADERITATFLPTPLCEAVLDEPWPAHTTLRHMQTGGSALKRGMPPGLPFTLTNVYGPAECTVGVTTAVVEPGGPVPPPIGFALDRVRCYVLDEELEPVPDGEPGEMCLAGECVARGYLNDPLLTAKSFVPDVMDPGKRMYRTGDRVRRMPDGSFEYFGRFDDQIKIRGFRIEPGEVATVLRQHPAVRESYVAADQSGESDPRLIGYVAADATPGELIEFVASRLPGYMVPSAIVVLETMPLTPNGKVDREALPAPDRVASGLTETVATLSTPTEGAVAGIVSRLLGEVPVGAGDDFYSLGGTSLHIGRLAAQLATELHAEVSPIDLMRAGTVTAIAALIDERVGEHTPVPVLDPALSAPARPAVGRARRDRPIPLSLQQERVWFFEQLSPGNLAYNFQATVALNGEVNVEALRASFDEIVRRHEVLRTAFVTVNGIPVQQPIEGLRAPFSVLDVPIDQVNAAVAEEVRKPFDLTRPPLARWVLLRHGGGENTLIHVEHHFVHDGWSLAVLLSDLSAIYPAFLAGQPSPLPELAVQYADYAVWQREWLQGEVLKAHVEHATDMLEGAPHVLELPADRPRPAVMTFRGAAPRIKFPAELSRALRAFSRRHKVSLFSTMYAGFAALLYRYTGRQDLVLGTGAANRSLPELEPLVGMMVNTVVLRTQLSGQTPFTELIEQVQASVVDALAWSDTPVEAVIDAIGPNRDPSRNPLFQIMFSFHDSAVPDVDFGGLTGAVTERANGSAKSDLNVVVIPRAAQRLGREARPEDDDLNMIWEHSTDLFDADTMSRMVEHYLNLLTDAVARPAAPIDELHLLADTESRLLDGWSHGPEAITEADTIPELFAAQVARDPGATALVSGTKEMSYAELDRRSNALAWRLLRHGVGLDEPVGVAIERGPDLVIALLAVLKAGGCYLPIESSSPAPRVAAMIAAARARLVLVAGETGLAGVETLDVTAETGDEQTAPPDRAHPQSLAYISFTSGSTGVPKGVGIPQRGVAQLVSNPSFVPLGPGQRLLHLAPVAFDASTLEIWGSLLTGATVVIAPPGPLGLADIASLLRTAEVTVVWLTAGLFHQLAETDIDALTGAPLVLSGGDTLNPDTVRAVLAARQGKPVGNGYGPTENTVFTTCHVMTSPSQTGPTVPIGPPVQGTTVRVLDESGQPVPIGVIGELYTGGEGLARGYAGNPAATAKVFVPDPFGSGGARLYRTGDLVRWLADGTLEFVGRVDDQVKIRGFRVEPGEVAAVLRSHPGVAESVVVVAGEGTQKHLIGYVTPAEGMDPSALQPSQLRDFLAGRLPEYLIPSGFKALDRFPLNANGKVDRAALPAPERDQTREIVAPQGATEKRLADIWRLLLPLGSLGGEDIGRTDTFFGIGGNSLSAARLMFRIHEVFGVEMRLASFYEFPTLAACAAAIDRARSAAAPAPAIGRRDRSAYRVAAAAPATGELASHLVGLAGDWALWRTVCLRAAGLPLQLLDALGDTSLAGAADQNDGGYDAEFEVAVRRLSAALFDAAGHPGLREAVAWQNRHALTTGIDVLVARGREPAKRNGQTRQQEALVASYLQRYCAKNDTIGFFGPVGWSRIDDERGIRVEDGQPLAARVTYLEGWAVRAIMAVHATALRPWLVPRRMPFVGLDNGFLRLPMAPRVPLTPAEAAVMRAVDGVRDARAVAEAVLADPPAGLGAEAEVFAVLGRLADNRRIAWQVDIAPQDIHPEKTMRALLSRVTDEGIREPALKALDELGAARDRLAGAGGDVDRVAAAMSSLEETFTRLAGIPATRRAGELYAGRTLVYEECLRGGGVRIGADTLDGVRDALALVLDSARWFTATCAEIFRQHIDEAYRQQAAALGTSVVPFADIWLKVNDAFFRQPPRIVEPAVSELWQRWAAILDLPDGVRQIRLRAADLRERVATQFPARARPWPTAVHHSPDLMYAGEDAQGRPSWVLGEVHCSAITWRYATWLEFHDDPDGLRAAARHDLGGPVVYLASTAESGGSPTRLSNVLSSAGDRRLVFAHDSCGYSSATAVMVGDCDVIDSPTGLRVRRRDGTFERDLLEVVGDPISGTIGNSFDLVPPGTHTPRVTIDDLVITRERWTLPVTDAGFSGTREEKIRYLQARQWAARHGMPRYVFVRVTGERKPIYADLTSLASIDLISRALRRSHRTAGAGAIMTVVEMLPTPDQAWLTDAEGRRYTAELRLVATDQKRED